MSWLFHEDEHYFKMKELLLKGIDSKESKKDEIERLYDKYKVDEILDKYKDEITNWDEILTYAYESQRGNKLLVITNFAKKKTEEKEFLEKLEKNYGIYLDVDTFIKEMKKKLIDIKNLVEMFKYLGGTISEEQTNYKMIKEAYTQAKMKNYLFSNRGDYRRRNRGGRGRGRGGRGGRVRGRVYRGYRGYGGRGRGF